jgi:hypothetical protein
MTRNPAAIHTHAHGKAVCGTFQIRDEDFGGRSSRIGSALAIVRDGGATNSTAIRVNTAIGIVTGMTPQVMMQAAAFILHVADAVSMVAVTARCTMIVRIGQGGLAFEHVPGVVKHNRHDAGDLSDQKQPEQPRAEAALRVQRSQRPPLDLEVPVKLGHFVLYSETRVARYLWRCCRQATVSEAGRVLIVGKAWR